MGTDLFTWERNYLNSTTNKLLINRPYSTVTDFARFLG